VTALARHAIGNCNHDESVEGVAASDDSNFPRRTEPALVP
jgi:hypothetical protein